VVRAVVKARRQPPTPAEVADLIGVEGVVVSALDPTGIVRAQKESWSARSLSGPVPEGAAVRVRSVQGLTLEVEPVETPQLERGEK
jgi:membrane-bound ClpP family serine protease